MVVWMLLLCKHTSTKLIISLDVPQPETSARVSQTSQNNGSRWLSKNNRTDGDFDLKNHHLLANFSESISAPEVSDLSVLQNTCFF